MSEVKVRSARMEDVEGLASLFAQLGYPEARKRLSQRLTAILADDRADLVVAEDGDGGALVGAAHIFFVPVAHENAPWCRITALVVDGAQRGRGLGRALVGAAEEAARKTGCSRIEATSALHRTEAHRFYEDLGYARSSAHFLKRLAAHEMSTSDEGA